MTTSNTSEMGATSGGAARREPFSDPAAELAVRQFMRASIDERDEAAARAMLSRSCTQNDSFQFQMPPPGQSYAVHPAVKEGGEVLVPVTLIDASASPPQTIQMDMTPVLEDGQWKVDLARAVDRMMGGAMKQMTDALGEAMRGVGEALGEGLKAAFGESSDSSSVEQSKATPSDFAANRVSDALRASFNGDTQANVRRLVEELIPATLEEVNRRLEFALPIEIDVEGLLTQAKASGDDGPRQCIFRIESDLLRNLSYFLSEANAKVPLEERLTSLRIEPTRATPGGGGGAGSGRVVFAEGTRIIYRCEPLAENGTYTSPDLEEILAGVAAGMASHVDRNHPSAAGPSFQPTGDARAIADAYKKKDLLTYAMRLSERAGTQVAVEIDWPSVTQGDSPGNPSPAGHAAATNLFIWGVNRVAGAAGLIALKPEQRDELSDVLRRVVIRNIADPAEKSCTFAGGVLSLSVALGAGEAGCFYEHDIARIVSKAMGSETRPVINDLRKEAAEWQNQLRELFKKPITYEVDYPGFTSHPDTGRNLFALNLLREHGIDHIFYAITGLAEKNPNFKQQFPRRVEVLRLLHVPDAAQKNLTSEGSAIVYRLFLHEGYHGYLTINDMQKRLPELVAKMKDLASAVEEDAAERAREAEEEGEADRLESAEEDNERGEAGGASGEGSDDPAVFNQLVAGIQGVLPNFTSQFYNLLGKQVGITIEWDTLHGSVAAANGVMAIVLPPLFAGIARSASNPALRQSIIDRLDQIVIANVDDPRDQQIMLAGSTLMVAVALALPNAVPLDQQTAASLIEALFTSPARGAGPQAKSKKPDRQPDRSTAKKSKPAAKSKKPDRKAAPAAKKKTSPAKSKAKPKPKPKSSKSKSKSKSGRKR